MVLTLTGSTQVLLFDEKQIYNEKYKHICHFLTLRQKRRQSGGQGELYPPDQGSTIFFFVSTTVSKICHTLLLETLHRT